VLLGSHGGATCHAAPRPRALVLPAETGDHELYFPRGWDLDPCGAPPAVPLNPGGGMALVGLYAPSVQKTKVGDFKPLPSQTQVFSIPGSNVLSFTLLPSSPCPSRLLVVLEREALGIEKNCPIVAFR